MKTFKGTKGEWWACCTDDDRTSHYVFVGDGEATICAMRSNDKSEKHFEANSYELSILERNANAKLIAAAPDLLEALQDLVKFCEENETGAELELAENAINKALK